jgi:hypothetical protein
MPVARDIRLEIHLVPAGIHHGERVVLVLVVTQPRVVRQAREDQLPAATTATANLTVRLGAAVALLRLDQWVAVGAEDVREVLVALVLGELGDLDGRAGPADRWVWLCGGEKRGSRR